MNAMILAAGLGTRLKPWTLTHPKAIVPVGGVPMLERVILKLRDEGFDNIVVNTYHFSDQVAAFLAEKDYGIDIVISDETGLLLDTGGGIVKAAELVDFSKGSLLVHNVDILSDANLCDLMKFHNESEMDATLLVSGRDSSRKLLFDEEMMLRGWHNNSTDEYRPKEAVGKTGLREFAFSGIHIMGENAIMEMANFGFGKSFPVMDYYLHSGRCGKVAGFLDSDLRLIDIGKPATLSQAEEIFR